MLVTEMRMANKANLRPDISYFELQAYVGTTKHMGGFETTRELMELCHVSKGTYVLDVGCGAGATASHLAKAYDCRVVGMDLREAMVTLSTERARRQGVIDHVEFWVADAQALPFDDATLDVVLCESVATFIEDKQRVVDELARAVKPGGHVGLNEEVWLKPPPSEVAERVETMWPVKSNLPTAKGWGVLLRGAGLHDVLVRAYKVDARREATQIRRYAPGDMFRMFWQALALFAKSGEFRAYMRKQRCSPKDVFEYLGYVVLVGRR
jgi:ubiquinone/menaquinone biosynthesis C-methylase UbiE